MKVLVAGATGNVGQALGAHLLRAGEDVRVLARDPEKATRILGPEVEVVRGNLGEPATIGSAFRGVQRAFLASAPTPTLVVRPSRGNSLARPRTPRLEPRGLGRAASRSADTAGKAMIERSTR